MSQNLFEQCKKSLSSLGDSLCDIHISGVTEGEWQKVFELLKDYPPLQFSIDGNEKPLPLTLSKVFEVTVKQAASLYFDVGNVNVACHFFSRSEIEFDFWPEEVADEKRFTKLVNFLQRIGSAINKDVNVTPEGGEDAPFLRYNARSKQVEFVRH